MRLATVLKATSTIVALVAANTQPLQAAAKPAAPLAAKDPCAIAFLPHEGTDRFDQEIIRQQCEARLAKDPLPWLERLGWAYIAKARASFDPGFYTLADQTALCMESKQAGSPEAMLLCGHVLHSLHKFKEGETVARALVARRGLSFDYGLLGDVLMEQGKLNEAVDAYQKMMDQRPSPSAYGRAAHLRWLKGDLRGAIELMEMAVRGGGSGDPESAAWYRVRLALYQLQAGDHKKSAALVNEALMQQPNYPPALLARGRILLSQGKATEAIEPLQRAATTNPLPEYKWLLAEALRESGRVDEARVVELQLKKRGATDDPRTLSLYLATRGEDVETAMRLGIAEMELRADVFTLDALAWASMADGDAVQAWVFMRRAIAEGTPDARLMLHAGVIAAAVGQKEKSGSYLAKASALQQMLLPCEQKILKSALEENPTLSASRKD